jgi:hypothetical protein
MAASSNEPMISEQAMHPTAPAPEISAKGLPEHPDVTEVELRAGADALTAQWQMLGPATGGASKGGLPERLKHLSVPSCARRPRS